MAYSDDEIIGALKACRGKIYVAADRIGCTPQTIYTHMEKNPAIKTLVDDLRSKMVDKAELKFEQAIDAGEHWAIAMALKTLGKDRGYVERQEVDQVTPQKHIILVDDDSNSK